MEIGGELLAQAVLHYGLDVASFERLGGMEGTAMAALRDGRPVVLKLSPMESGGPELDRLAERCRFALFLAEHGVPVVRPLTSNDGRLVVPMVVAGQQYSACLSERAPGQHADRRDSTVWNDSLFSQWGEIMGQMHALAKKYPRWRADGARPTLLTGWQEEHQFFQAWCQDDGVRAKWEAMGDLLGELPQDRDSYGLIHNDFHPFNFRVEQGKITLFDFGVCGFHWFAKDLAIPLFFVDWQRPPASRQPFRQYVSRFFAAFMRGYRRHNMLDLFWLEQLPMFLKHHQMLLFIVFSDAWGGSPQRWQARQLARWRAAIITDMPVFNFPLSEAV